jgi:tetratricopeptide (TPR) repeat protein
MRSIFKTLLGVKPLSALYFTAACNAMVPGQLVTGYAGIVLFRRCLAAFAAFSSAALAAPVPSWRLTRSDHFEIYAQSSDQRARAILDWFEKLRAFFQQPGWTTASAPPSSRVRVIVFASTEEYQPYRLRATADAYYVGSGDRNYIVMSGGEAKSFPIAAHEYAHLVLRASGSKMLPWLTEGLAEVYSTLRMDDRGAELGGPLRGRLQALRNHAWMPLAALTSLPKGSIERQERGTNDLFYAESWALTGMLALSPGYASRFPRFVAAAGEGVPSLDLLTRIYGKSAEELTHDLRVWVAQDAPATVQLPRVLLEPKLAEVSGVAPLAARVLIGQLLVAEGEFDLAEALFLDLYRDAPDSPEVSAALGIIALHKGDSAGARRAWKRAIDEGITDAKLCYKYAILADQAGLPADDIRGVLERAIALQPDFDDAHYQLALIDKNAGRYEAALREFQAMRIVTAARAYGYWLAVADTFNELGRREEAQSAAERGALYALTEAERTRADEQAFIAQTDLGVRFAHDAAGRPILVTARMPHQTADWNPFVEPGDDMHRLQGQLREIDCGNVTTIRVEAAGKLVALAIPDLQHVQMRHAPDEFVCGAQSETPVIVDYAQSRNRAAEGIVRGMDFSPISVSPAGAP